MKRVEGGTGEHLVDGKKETIGNWRCFSLLRCFPLNKMNEANALTQATSGKTVRIRLFCLLMR